METDMEKMQKRKKFLIDLLYVAAILGIIFLFFKFVFGWVAPFVVGIAIAIAIDPLIRFLKRKLKIQRAPMAIFFTLLFWAIIAFVAFKCGELVYQQAENLLKYIQTLSPDLIFEDVSSWIKNIVPQFDQQIDVLLNSAGKELLSFFTSILTWMTGFLISLPDILIFLVVSIMASIFISIDLPKIRTFISVQIPKNRRTDFLETKMFFQTKIFNIIRAYALIISITFIELLVAFLLIGIEYALLLALLVALLDLLPIIGTATFLVPWGIITMIGGDTKVGIWLIVVAVIVSVIREIIQPKIVGGHIGLSPLLTLMGMYIGLKLLGIFGMLLIPLCMIFIKSLNDSGRIHLWKSVESEEKPQKTFWRKKS